MVGAPHLRSVGRDADCGGGTGRPRSSRAGAGQTNSAQVEKSRLDGLLLDLLRLLLYHLPSVLNVALRGVGLRNAQSQGETIIQLCMREIEITAAVQCL